MYLPLETREAENLTLCVCVCGFSPSASPRCRVGICTVEKACEKYRKSSSHPP